MFKYLSTFKTYIVSSFYPALSEAFLNYCHLKPVIADLLHQCKFHSQLSSVTKSWALCSSWSDDPDVRSHLNRWGRLNNYAQGLHLVDVQPCSDQSNVVTLMTMWCFKWMDPSSYYHLLLDDGSKEDFLHFQGKYNLLRAVEVPFLLVLFKQVCKRTQHVFFFSFKAVIRMKTWKINYISHTMTVFKISSFHLRFKEKTYKAN